MGGVVVVAYVVVYVVYVVPLYPVYPVEGVRNPRLRPRSDVRIVVAEEVVVYPRGQVGLGYSGVVVYEGLVRVRGVDVPVV